MYICHKNNHEYWFFHNHENTISCLLLNNNTKYINKNNSNGKAKKTKLNVKKTNKYIHSIKSLYYLAINYPIDKEINGYRISDLVCYNKTSHIYIKYIKGLKLIVCKFHRYDSINKCIYFNYHSKQNIIKIKACFNDVKMYTDIKNRIYGYKGNVLYLLIGQLIVIIHMQQ